VPKGRDWIFGPFVSIEGKRGRDGVIGDSNNAAYNFCRKSRFWAKENLREGNWPKSFSILFENSLLALSNSRGYEVSEEESSLITTMAGLLI